MPPESSVRAIEARLLSPAPASDAQAVGEAVREAGGDSVLALIFFGSRKTRAAPDPWSAYDLFVLTKDYGSFYRSLHAQGHFGRSPLLATALNSFLPPNQISITAGIGEAGAPRRAKCSVITLARLVAECSERRRDHFCIGRLFQATELIWARDELVRTAVKNAVISAHHLTLRWVRPWLPPVFDVDQYCRSLLGVSLSREIRPESRDRAEALWNAQKDHLRPVYSALLAELAAGGELIERETDRYALTRPVGPLERFRTEAYFRKSLVRATLRWSKHMLTFEGWLDYIVRKVERHTGQSVVLSARERHWPLIFLWPRFVRFLRRRKVAAEGDLR